MTGMPDRVVIYKDENQDWRWRRVSPNGRILSDSSEGYENRKDCIETSQNVNALPYILEVEGVEPPQIYVEGIEK